MFDRRVEGCPCGMTRPGQLSGIFQAAKVAACRRLYRPEPILGGFRFRFVFSCFLVNARFCLWWVGKQVRSMKTDVKFFCTNHRIRNVGSSLPKVRITQSRDEYFQIFNIPISFKCIV